MSLFNYQRETVDWLCEDLKTCRYVAHEPGLGKTYTAIAFADRIGAKRVLVISPAHGRENWRREFENRQLNWRQLRVVRTGNDNFPLEDPLSLILSYDVVSRAGYAIREYLMAPQVSWDLLILDEAHMLGRNSERTRFLLNPHTGLFKRARYTLPLSGTPATKSASELFPIMRALWPHMVNGHSWTSFEDEYCRIRKYQTGTNYREIRQIEGTKPEKLTKLKNLLKPVMSILKTDNVMKDIPSLRVTNYPLMMSLLDKKSRETTVLKNLDARLATVFDEEGDFLTNLSKAELTFATERRAIGMAKVTSIVQLVSDELTSDTKRKIVIFAFHRDVIFSLCHGLDTFGVVTVDGSRNATQKQTAQDAFQTDPNIRVFVGQIKAASTNLTLTAAHDVILAEASWNPGDNYQAIRRCRRIGQTKPVLARYISMSGADDRINEVLAARSMELDTLFATESADHEQAC